MNGIILRGRAASSSETAGDGREVRRLCHRGRQGGQPSLCYMFKSIRLVHLIRRWLVCSSIATPCGISKHETPCQCNAVVKWDVVTTRSVRVGTRSDGLLVNELEVCSLHSKRRVVSSENDVKDATLGRLWVASQLVHTIRKGQVGIMKTRQNRWRVG